MSKTLRHTNVPTRRARVLYVAVILFIFIASIFMPLLASAAAGVPKVLNHQGRLLDASGNLLGGAGTNFCFKFAIYDDATVGGADNQLWPSGATSTMTVNVKNGVFNVGIGDASAGGDTLDYNFQDNDTIYLGVDVATKVGGTCAGGDEVFERLTPRQRIDSSGFAINASTVGGFTPSQTATGNQIPVLSSSVLSVPTASTTLATTSQLVVSSSFTFKNVTGFLKATAGVVATAFIDLANDVGTSILAVANGGTGWAAIQSGTIPYGNGTGALATTTAGTAGNVLALLNGVPTWTATTTLSTISGTLAETKGGTNQSTYATGDILYSSGTNVLGKLGIGTGGLVLGVSGGLPAWVATTTFSGGLTFSGGNVTNTGVTSIIGTANQISASGPTGAVTLSLPTLLALTNASSTALSGLDYMTVGRTATTPIRGATNATSTFAGGIQGTYLNMTGTAATSTFARGIDLAGGCFSINGTCVGGGGAVSSVTADANNTLTISPNTGAVIAGLNLANPNTWTGLQQFSNATSTLLESMTFFARTIVSTSTNALALKSNFSSTAGLTFGGTTTPQVLGIDTINNRVNVGTGGASPSLFVVDTKNTAGDPTGVNGATYYNSNTNMSRCYVNSAWEDCGSTQNYVNFEATAEPAAPATGEMRMFGRNIAERILPAVIGPSGQNTSLQPLLARNKVGYWNPAGNAVTVPGVFGFTAPTTVGTVTARNVATTNFATRMRRLGYVSAATAGSLASARVAVAQYTIGNGAGLGGFTYIVRFVPSDAAAVSGERFFVGLTSATGAPTNVDPATLTNAVGLAQLSSGTNCFVVYGGSAAQTAIDLGTGFDCSTRSTEAYELALFAPKDTNNTVYYLVTRLSTGATASGTLTGTAGTVLPSSTTLLAHRAWKTNNATALAVGFDIASIYIETDD